MILLPDLDRQPARSPEPSSVPRDDPAQHAASWMFDSYCGRALGGVPTEISRLRFEVYCLECAFLPADIFTEGLERDPYDTQAMHFAASTLEQRLIGSVRLVQPAPGEPYPFQQHCTMYAGHVLPAPGRAAEISRLVVRKGYRRRRADSLAGVPGRDAATAELSTHEQWRRTMGRRSDARDSPMLLFGLYREMFRYSQDNGIRYWYAAMERSLLRSLKRLGLAFEPIGPQADYYGAVTPCVLDLHVVEQSLRSSNPVLAGWFLEPPFAIAA